MSKPRRDNHDGLLGHNQIDALQVALYKAQDIIERLVAVDELEDIDVIDALYIEASELIGSWLPGRVIAGEFGHRCGPLKLRH